MIDTLTRLLPHAAQSPVSQLSGQYVLVTLHRPSNVDDPDLLSTILQAILAACQEAKVVFPAHPRTRARLYKRPDILNSLELVEPLPYLEFISLESRATAVITDSGGVQEETTYLGVPCLTVRDNTERPVTVNMGTNILVGRDTERLRAEVDCVLHGQRKYGRVPPLWDGHAADRIAATIV